MEDIPKSNIVKEFSLKIKQGKAIRLPKKIKDELKFVYMQQLDIFSELSTYTLLTCTILL